MTLKKGEDTLISRRKLYIALCGEMALGIEVTGRRGRRRKRLLDDITERRGYSHLKEEALDRTVWRAGFGDRSDRKTRKKT